MAIPNIPDVFSFRLWWEKTNLIADLEGDLDLLLTVDKSNLVSAINEIYAAAVLGNRDVLIRAIAMS